MACCSCWKDKTDVTDENVDEEVVCDDYATHPISNCPKTRLDPSHTCHSNVGCDPETEFLRHAFEKFGWDLFSEMVADRSNDNILISPPALGATMCMLLAGCRNNTAEEIFNVLQIAHSNLKVLHTKVGEIVKSVNDSSGTTLNSKIFAETKLIVRPKYIKTLKKEYKHTKLEDLKSSIFVPIPFEENTVDYCNLMMEKYYASETGVKCQMNLTKSRDPNAYHNSGFVIVSTLQFKGQWRTGAFNPSKNWNKPFYGDKKIKTTYMCRNLQNIWYYEDDEHKCTMCSLQISSHTVAFLDQPSPYYSSLIIILPKERKGLSRLEKELTVNRFAALMKRFQKSGPHNVALKLPRFRIPVQSTCVPMSKYLRKMGINDVFDNDKANLAGICKRNDICVHDIHHQGFLSIDEYGANQKPKKLKWRAQGSAEEEDVETADTVKMTVDHPCIIVIQDSEGNTNFLGRMTRPQRFSVLKQVGL